MATFVLGGVFMPRLMDRSVQAIQTRSCVPDGPSLSGGVKRMALLLLFLPVLLLGLMPGCGGGDRTKKEAESPVAITVGTLVVPLSEVESSFWEYSRGRPNVPADSASLSTFVPILVQSKLLHAMALDSLPVLTGQPKENLEEVKERRMVDVLRQRTFAEASRVNEGMVQKAYDLLGRKARASYMALGSKAEAEEAVRALKEGALFSKLAEQKSLDQNSRAKGGDIGWVVYTDLDADVSDKLFAMQPGQLLGPMAADDQFRIFRVEEVGTNEKRRPLEQERPLLERNIKMTNMRRALKVYLDDLLVRYKYAPKPAEMAWMTVFLREKTANARRGVQFDEQGRPIGGVVQQAVLPWKENPVTPADSGHVVATYDSPTNGGRITPLRVVDQLVQKPSIGWPTFESIKDTETLVRNLVIEEVEIREAQRQGAEKWPEVVSLVNQRQEEIRDRVYYRHHVHYKALLSDAQALAYYEAHRSQFMEPERRRFIGVNSAKWENALKAKELFKAGRSPEEIHDLLAPGDTTIQITTSKGTDLMSFGQSPLLDRFLFKLPLNGVSDPIPVSLTFTVAKVVEIEPSRQKTFEESKDEIQETVGGAKEDSVRALVLAEARENYPVTIHWDVVRQARLQPPPPTKS
jgi:parvulin-like peptidyl-prolyl isomerase